MAEYIEQKSPETAIAPQVVIRRVRVMKNAGNIQGLAIIFSDTKCCCGNQPFSLKVDVDVVLFNVQRTRSQR